MIEQLEVRRFYSANATLAGSTLSVVGSNSSDTIEFAAGRKLFQVFVNGVETSYEASKVRLIHVFGNSSNDTIILSPRLAFAPVSRADAATT